MHSLLLDAFSTRADNYLLSTSPWTDRMNSSELLKPRRVLTARLSSHPDLQSVFHSVECAEDEDVEWLWTEVATGRFVSGYQLVSRPPQSLAYGSILSH
jgi:hypothetical protein